MNTAVSVAVVTLDSIDTTLTPGRSVSLAIRSPTGATRHPTYLRLAHGTPQPITAPLLHQYHVTLGTHHSLASFDHFIQHVTCSSRVLVRFRVRLHMILVLFTVQTIVNSLTRQTVQMSTHRTPELVHIILEYAPSSTVGRLAMERILYLSLSVCHRFGQVLLVRYRTDERLDLALLNDRVAGVRRVTVRTLDADFRVVVNGRAQTGLAE
uniref:Uncharacterized protein n=1 Tax=Cacopsylla melanoneura TaxID=428564 RepID=A0A8D8UA43_9HEMI